MRPSSDFVDAVISRLTAFRDEVYDSNGYAHIGITMSMCFDDKLIAHIGAHGNNISTINDLCESLGTKFHWNLLDSLIGRYAAQILDIVAACNDLHHPSNPKDPHDQPPSQSDLANPQVQAPHHKKGGNTR